MIKMTKKTKKDAKCKRLKLKPYLVLGKKKHPYGKPKEIYVPDLRIWVSPSYLSNIGFTKTGQVGSANDKINNLTIFLENKDIEGWIYLEKEEAYKLQEILNKMLDKRKNGVVKRTFSGLDVTKTRKKQDLGRPTQVIKIKKRKKSR